MVDTLPGNVSDVQKTIYAAQINERAVICDILDDTLKDLAFLKVGHKFAPCLCP